MDFTPLNPVEARVLGSLIEKQIATPDYYPLSLNALVNACNQLTNREPVVVYDEATVVRGLDGLRERRLATLIQGGDSRVPKYRHALTEVILLTPAEVALLCALMLRGPQTVGELRARTERLHAFASLTEVEEVLGGLAAHTPQPLVAKLPKQPGSKEHRHTQLLGGSVIVDATPPPPAAEPAPVAARAEGLRLDSFEAEISRLRSQIDYLRMDLERVRAEADSFRKQFDGS